MDELFLDRRLIEELKPYSHGRTCFTTKIHWNTRLAAFDVFHMFLHNQLSPFNPITVQMSEKRVSSNKQ